VSVNLLLRGGSVVDGSGAPPRAADVLVGAGRILAMGRVDDYDLDGTEVREVAGLTVCPGFVDIHTHSDLTLLSSPAAYSKVGQGVTTEVVGNCGLGAAPLVDGVDRVALRLALSYLDLDPEVAWSWSDLAGYLRELTAAGPSLNVATLTGHLPLRAGVVGFGDESASRAQVDRMTGLLADSFAQGSVGLSTGLVYAPLCYAAPDELLALGAVVAAHSRVFTWHVRDYTDELLPSVAQAIEVARRTGCRTQISHLTTAGRRNWGSVAGALELVDRARLDGLEVGVDIYPYVFGNAPLSQVLPAWVQEGGFDAMARRLADAAVRDRIRAGWRRRPFGWADVTISWVPSDSAAVPAIGLTVAELAARTDRDGDDVALELLGEIGNSVLVILGARSEEDLRAVLDHPGSVIASDGLSLDPEGVTGQGTPHPRCYGCFPRYLVHYAGHSDAEFGAAVRKCTAAPAAIVGLADRGLLGPGAVADIVVLDRARLADRATFSEPQAYPDGIELVLVNGEIVVDHGSHTAARAGQVLGPP